jgi:hypothetical protein
VVIGDMCDISRSCALALLQKRRGLQAYFGCLHMGGWCVKKSSHQMV